MTASDTTTTTQGELEKLVSDLRGLLANKDLDAVPEIKLLRQRLEEARLLALHAGGPGAVVVDQVLQGVGHGGAFNETGWARRLVAA